MADVLPRLRHVLRTRQRATLGEHFYVAYKREFLREVDIFRGLSHEDLQWLEATTRITVAKKGQIIYHQEQAAEVLYLLKKGRVRLSRITPGGKKLELAVLEPGTFFGEMPLLGERSRNAFAEALDDCILCVMSQSDIERLVLRKPEVGLRMLEVLGRRLAEREARLEDLAYRSVPSRLAALLLRLGQNADDAIEGISHQELGDMVGAYRETVTKVLGQLQSLGYLELSRRRIRILDRAGLTALVDEV